MPPLSTQKKEKIAEQVLHHLFMHAPQALFTASIAQECARDEEFMKALLLELEQRKLVVCITKNTNGQEYTARKRWRLADQVYTLYKTKQNKGNITPTAQTAHEHD